jgi:hypothetical protein
MKFLKKLYECFFEWHIKGTSYEGADVIISHAGGDKVGGEPGAINEYIETIIRDIYAKTKLPIIAQAEVAQCIRDLPLVGNIPFQSESPTYLDTVDVAKMQLDICKEHGWTRPLVVSCQPHLWRVVKVFEKLGVPVLIADVPKMVFEPKCSQFWMRNAWLNNPRDLLCRLYWLVQGKI